MVLWFGHGVVSERNYNFTAGSSLHVHSSVSRGEARSVKIKPVPYFRFAVSALLFVVEAKHLERRCDL
jgi:hypothetical protein